MVVICVLGAAVTVLTIMMFACADMERPLFDFERPHLNLDD